MKLNLKKIIVIIVLTIVAVVLVPFLINNMFKVDLGIEYLQSEWEAGDMLGFYGAILSGMLTFLGVLLTLRHEKEERDKDDSIKYKPILELSEIDNTINCGYREVGLVYAVSFLNENPRKEELAKKFLENQCGQKPKYKLYFKNVGRGETFNARIDKYEISNLNWNDISNLSSKYPSSQYIGEIIQNGYFGVYVKLPDYLILPKESSDFELSTKLYISYADMFDRMKYQYIVHIRYKILPDSIETDAPDVSDSRYQYTKVHYVMCQIMPIKMVYSEAKKQYVFSNNLSVDE